jgi:hypothetical protein
MLPHEAEVAATIRKTDARSGYGDDRLARCSREHDGVRIVDGDPQAWGQPKRSGR